MLATSQQATPSKNNIPTVQHPDTLASMNKEEGKERDAAQQRQHLHQSVDSAAALTEHAALTRNFEQGMFEETWKAVNTMNKMEKEWKEAKELWHKQKDNLNRNQQERCSPRHVETSFLGQELGPSYQQHWGTSPYMGWAGYSQDTQQCAQQLQLQQHFQTQGYHPSMVQDHSCMPSSAPIPPGSVHKQPQSKKTQAKMPKPEKSETSQSEMLKELGHKAETLERLVGAFSCGKAVELGEQDLVKDSGFESEVQKFLNDDSKFPWACLAGVKMLADHSKENPGVSHSDTETAGIVVIKSDSLLDSSLIPSKISCGIWQKKDDARLTRHIKSEVIVQIFGQEPQDGDSGVPAHAPSLEAGEKPTIITAEFRCFTGTKDEDAGDLKLIDLNQALAKEGLTLLQDAFKRSNIELRGTPVDFSDYCDIVTKRLAARANTRSNVPKPEIREKLLAGNTDSLCFLIRDAKELGDLNMVKESGFQNDVKDFLNDPDLTWTCLAGVRMPNYHKNENYGMRGHETKNLGVVAIKSSDGTVTPLRISARIWLRKKDLNVIRRIITQIVLQVFGANPMHRNHDVRRNHHTMEDVFKDTPIKAVVRCFCDESHTGEMDENDEGLVIKLNQADPYSLQRALESHHFTLTGQEQHFSKVADLVAKRLKARPEVDKRFKWKTIKDFEGEWLPGNLFKVTLSEPLSFDLEKIKGYRKDLDGHIVVLLPPQEAKQAFVAPLDSRRRRIYVVPRITLQPVSDQDSGKQEQPDTDKLKDYLKDKYKFKVLVRHEEDDRWRKGRLCLGVAGRRDSCMVQFDDEQGSEPRPVNASDLQLVIGLTNCELGEGREAATLASSKPTGETVPHWIKRSIGTSEMLESEFADQSLLAGNTDNLSFLIKDAKELSDLDMVKESGFQSEVQRFFGPLEDPDFPWTCLAAVRKPADESNESSVISDNQTKTLGVVAIKSSNGVGTLLKISAGIWLRREDRRVFRGIIAQIVLQVFGKARLHESSDVRRNRFTLRGIGKATQIKAHLCCFIRNEKSHEIEKPQPKEDEIAIKTMCGKDGRWLLETASSSLNLTLTGEEQDFLDYADIVALMVHLDKQLNEGAPEVDKCLKWPKWQTINDFKGDWLPGNLFKFTRPKHLPSDLVKTGGYQKDLDGCIVVLLPWNDCHGSLQLKEEEEVLVAPVDSTRRAIYLVPRMALHPVSTDGKQLEQGTQKPKELTRYLEGKYQYKVLMRSQNKWRNARLCMEVVGGDKCTVQSEDGEHPQRYSVNVSDLRLAKDLKSRGALSAGHDRADLDTIVSSQATTATL